MRGKDRLGLWGYPATSRVKINQAQSTEGQLEASMVTLVSLWLHQHLDFPF